MGSDCEALLDSQSWLLPAHDGIQWSELPPDVLQFVGSMLNSPGHVHCASLVCKNWSKNLRAGVRALEVDVNPNHELWVAKVQQLQQLTPGLSSCKAHVSSAVRKEEFGSRIKLLSHNLQNMQHLDLELSEGFELWLNNADELSELNKLRSLSLSGGAFSPAAAEQLLQGLAVACPQLEELHVLPGPCSGLGDQEVPLLAKLTGLKVLEFRAYHLSAAGLTRLTGQLPQLVSLSCHGLDSCLDAATASCFASRPSLRELHLGMDYELPEGALQQLRNVAGDLSMKFRWTDKLSGLLRTAKFYLQARLVRLDLGCVRLARDPSSTLIEPLAALTALSDLRMSVYSNGDATLTLQLSELSALSNLQVLHLAKQHAYFPEQRRIAESSIAVPFCAASAAHLAAGCQKLRSLRLCLGRNDVAADGLAQLQYFKHLRSLSVSAEPFGTPSQPVPLDLLHLPRGLTSLELKNIDIITPPALLTGDAVVCANASMQYWGSASSSTGAEELAGFQAAASMRTPQSVLDQLACLKLESCRLRTPQLKALSLNLPNLQQLRLAHVAGVSDEGIMSLSCITSLLELTVLGPHNKALSQNSLAALAPIRGLRYLSWQSDDLTALGPAVEAYSQFTTLRLLSLSCTPATLQFACGADGQNLFRTLLPYCNLDLIC